MTYYVWFVRIQVAVVIFAVTVLSGQPLWAALNVKDFGARGDNVTDDTAAIRAALAAAQQAYTLNTHPGSGGSGIPTRPEIHFPSGRYLISEPIYVAGGVLRGEGEALIIQKHEDQDIFTSTWAWRMTISGLTFVGGRHQLNLSNPNSDSGFVLIDQCRFNGAAGIAILMDKEGYSTQLKVRNCAFLQPEQVLVSYADETNVTDCWITTSRRMSDKAVIECRGGRMVFEKILGAPQVDGSDQRWVDVYSGSLTCRNFRFGGEGGGFTPVVNYAKYLPRPNSSGLGPSILLEGGEIYARGNKKRRCAIYCEEIPNGIVIRECAVQITPLTLAPRLKLENYFAGAEEGMLGYFLVRNRGFQVNQLPPLLASPQVQKR